MINKENEIVIGIKEPQNYKLGLLVSLIFVISCLLACKTSYEYSFEEVDGPYYFENYINSDKDRISTGTIKVISYNIEFANNFEKAIELLNRDPFDNFDIILLQEMDEISSDSISRALKCSYIFYPAIAHPGQEKLVGNTILSKWPIKSHYKLKLPHPSIYPVINEGTIYKFRKLATVATININGKFITCYSAHGAAFNTSRSRRAISQTIVNDIHDSNAQQIIVGGDFNTVGYGDIHATVDPFLEAGIEWATQYIGSTIGHRRWMLSFFRKEAFQADHLFFKGFKIIDVGKIENSTISDHFPIWIELELSE